MLLGHYDGANLTRSPWCMCIAKIWPARRRHSVNLTRPMHNINELQMRSVLVLVLM